MRCDERGQLLAEGAVIMSITSTIYYEDGSVVVRVTPGNGITLDQSTGQFSLKEES